ncbi:hypothetical protein OHT17_18875 [Streptomyces sp. NBC_00371]|uniref:hypothetical protein n=2 Tax=Streptomyces TaxID=1883 RepID=UPI002E25EDEC
MNAMSVISFALAAVLLLAACVKADRVRAWRHAFNPSGDEVPDAAFTVGRVVFVVLAGVVAFSGFQLRAVAADSVWSDDELSHAVEYATGDLDGHSYFGMDVPSDSDYESMVEDAVVRRGGGGAPGSGVSATPSGTGTTTHGAFTVQADGADASFCVSVTRTKSKDGGYDAPGIAGGPSGTADIVPLYELAATSRKGPC